MANGANNPSAVRDPRLRERLLALLVVDGFFTVQELWFLEGRRMVYWWEPTPVLGPLYFLCNKSTADDWLGYVLLAVLAPWLLAFAVWPRPATAVLAVIAIVAWIGPGVLMILRA